ncbi:MAG: hypothetical protein ACYSUL_13560 [Planctomycetota bacterium]|jgi:hypothetical protein
MNADTLFEMAEKEIKDIQPWMASRFHICRWEGKFRCLPESHTTRPHDIFGTYSRKDLFRGLSPKQLGELRKILADYWEENKI